MDIKERCCRSGYLPIKRKYERPNFLITFTDSDWSINDANYLLDFKNINGLFFNNKIDSASGCYAPRAVRFDKLGIEIMSLMED